MHIHHTIHNEDRTSKDKENGVLIIAHSKRQEQWNVYKMEA